MKECSFVKTTQQTPAGEIGWTMPVDTAGMSDEEAIQTLTLTTHRLREAILTEFAGAPAAPQAAEESAEEAAPKREGRRASRSSEDTKVSRRNRGRASVVDERASTDERDTESSGDASAEGTGRRRGRRRGRTEAATEEAKPRGRGRGRRAAKASTEEAEETPAARRSGRGRRKAAKTTETIAPIVDKEVVDTWLDDTASPLFAKFVDLESGEGSAADLSDKQYDLDFEADMKELIGSPVAEIYKLTVPQFEKLSKETEKAMNERLEDDDDLDGEDNGTQTTQE